MTPLVEIRNRLAAAGRTTTDAQTHLEIIRAITGMDAVIDVALGTVNAYRGSDDADTAPSIIALRRAISGR
jgi:hypothetical protein